MSNAQLNPQDVMDAIDAERRHRRELEAENKRLRAALVAIADGSLAFPPDNAADFSTPTDLATYALDDAVRSTT